MPEAPQTPAAAQPPAPVQAPAQPATEFTVPEGKRLVDAADHERMLARVRGFEPFVQHHKALGIKDPKDFERYVRLANAAKAQGIDDMDLLANALAEPAHPETPQGGAGGGLDLKALETWYAKKKEADGLLSRTDYERERGLDTAKMRHESAARAEAELVKRGLTEFLGENPTAWERFSAEKALAAYLDEKRPMYPEDHPLSRSALSPMDEKGIAGVWEELKKIKAQGEGEKLAQKGDAVNRGAKASAGGASGTNAPSKPAKDADERRPGGLPSKAAVEAAYAKRVANRGGGPVSSAGG